MPTKEVQDTMVDALETDSQFVNAVAEIIGLWTPKLVSKFF